MAGATTTRMSLCGRRRSDINRLSSTHDGHRLENIDFHWSPRTALLQFLDLRKLGLSVQNCIGGLVEPQNDVEMTLWVQATSLPHRLLAVRLPASAL
jgi:hypothetical protein